MLPATRACLQGFREFLRCYRGATDVLPCYQGRDKVAVGPGSSPSHTKGAKDVKGRKCFLPPPSGIWGASRYQGLFSMVL